ncbi:restriction endonuclease subunit S [Salmonella enterica]|uniref:Restriction endonuclease subunit S n=1 Tax=Salmonella enterica TaxID=28901 RepID=A0A403EXR8_SALER|nr:restriction endonuclease subunit S [Salmonella enterica]EBH8098104.1 restriction endonuclease subunit S [Salmonella enterica subsp. houtenae serovar O:11:g,z25:-]EEJ1558424.1 restriction endonuclease subunit S [Salmonella enterica subsp. houtenae]EAY4742124.1 restriction endonuclease subunit S [Salmonella enterica]EAZ9459472.1 restriction endonuclease subunit S [Salmonella enterica]
MAVENLIVDHIDTWTTARQTRSTAGRGSSGKIDLYGIKKLRELILELAVRGKLVPQDPNDEPASVLLERIAAEKAELVKQGKIKKQKPLPEISEEEKPFELPEGWEWVALQAICSLENGDRSKNYPNKSTLVETGIPFVNAGHLENGNIRQEDMTFITPEHFSILRSGKFLDGDILFCLRGSLGKSAIVQNLSGAIASSLVIVRVFEPTFNKYIHLYFDAPLSYDFINKYDNGTAQPNLAATDLARFLVPLPPLDEQSRIVNKITELMTLCDQLEQHSLTCLDSHQQLVETLLTTLTDSQNADELTENWARISEHFDTLFTTEASIDALKQTILQLAVMGKLVPQDPNDSSAEILLEQLSVSRNKKLKQQQAGNKEAETMLRKINKLKKAKPPFKLPHNWTTVHLIEICEYLVDCHNKTAPYTNTGIPIIRTTNIRERRFLEQDLKFISQETYDFWSKRCPPSPGDIIFTREAPMGEALIIPPNVKWCLGQRTMLIRVMHEFVSNEFLLLALTEPHLLERASENAVGLTVKHLRVGDVENLNIPLPPLNEQYRIIDKVNILFEYCNKLKSNIKATQQTQLHLADALTDAAIN